jgi:phosphatidylinositol 4-kinase type 2
MPVNRSEYQPLAQSVEDDLEQGDVGLHQTQPTSPSRTLGRRPQIDLRTIDTAFKKWTENIAQKVKRKKVCLSFSLFIDAIFSWEQKEPKVEKREIMHTVFGPEVPVPHTYTRPVGNYHYVLVIFLTSALSSKLLTTKLQWCMRNMYRALLGWRHMMYTDEVYSLTDSVREAISEGINPKMITKGSSGSYFVRAKVEGRLQIVGWVHSGFL